MSLERQLEQKFGKIRKATQGYFRIPCPTCQSPDKAKEMKRYVHPNRSHSGCFICQTWVPVEQLVGGTFKPDPNYKFERVEHPMSRVLPFSSAIRLKNLPKDHAAIKFLTKDHLHDINVYSDKYKMAFIPEVGSADITFESGSIIKTCDALFFPVFFKGEYVGWQIRYIPGTWYGDKMTKMRYLHLFNKGDYLFNYDRAKEHENVIVMEGVKKALKHPSAVATFGKGISSRQFELIQEWKFVTFMLDGDNETQEKAEEFANLVRMNGRNCININPSKYGFPSPDEMTNEQIKEIVDSSWRGK